MGECAAVWLESRIYTWQIIDIKDCEGVDRVGRQKKGSVWTSELGWRWGAIL
jgi:hypothetical protein